MTVTTTRETRGRLVAAAMAGVSPKRPRNPLTSVLLAGAIFAQVALSLGCSRKEKASGTPGGPTATAAPRPGDPDCYKTAGAAACPPNLADQSGMKLPTPGMACSLAPCAVCGSASAAAFRDSSGAAKPGWCICVTKSDNSGANIYSCFGVGEWQYN